MKDVDKIADKALDLLGKLEQAISDAAPAVWGAAIDMAVAEAVGAWIVSLIMIALFAALSRAFFFCRTRWDKDEAYVLIAFASALSGAVAMIMSVCWIHSAIMLTFGIKWRAIELVRGML